MNNQKSIQLSQGTIHYTDKPDERDKIIYFKALQQEKVEKYVRLLEILAEKNIDKQISFKFLVQKLSSHIPLIHAIKIAKVYKERVQAVKMDW